MQSQRGESLPVVLEVGGNVWFGERDGQITVRQISEAGCARRKRCILCAHQVAKCCVVGLAVVVEDAGIGRVLVIEFAAKEERLVAMSPGGVVLYLGDLHRAALREVGISAEIRFLESSSEEIG